MIGKYKLYDKEPEKEELDSMSEEELLEFFGNYIGINTRPTKQPKSCINENCTSENWYRWSTGDTLKPTYWLCTDCYQVKSRASTG